MQEVSKNTDFLPDILLKARRRPYNWKKLYQSDRYNLFRESILNQVEHEESLISDYILNNGTKRRDQVVSELIDRKILISERNLRIDLPPVNRYSPNQDGNNLITLCQSTALEIKKRFDNCTYMPYSAQIFVADRFVLDGFTSEPSISLYKEVDKLFTEKSGFCVKSTSYSYHSHSLYPSEPDLSIDFQYKTK